MTVTVYKSTDASAPVMCGQYGKLVQLLDAILVNGYGAKASLGWSIAYNGYTASGTATGGANNKLIDTSQNFVTNGVTVGMSVKRTADGLYGGITSISTTTNPNDTLNYTNTTNTPTFANLDAYSIDGNVRVYRAPTGNRYYLRVADTSSTTYARMRGWEVKADALDVVDGSNTGPFPTDAQLSGGDYYFKSDAASSAARTWRCLGNDKIFYLFARSSSDSVGGYMGQMIFGDFITYKASDVYNTVIEGHSSASASGSGFGSIATAVGQYKPRTAAGTGGSVQIAFNVLINNYQTKLFYGSLAYPDPITGSIIISPVVVIDTGHNGHFPGLWSAPFPLANLFVDLDTFSGMAGPLSGKTFEIWNFTLGNFGATASIIVETSNTWS
jgi:hypothetical protein